MAGLNLRRVLRLGKSRGVTIPPMMARQLRLQPGIQVQWLQRGNNELVLRNVDRAIRDAVGI